jgi:hypothetical protein
MTITVLIMSPSAHPVELSPGMRHHVNSHGSSYEATLADNLGTRCIALFLNRIELRRWRLRFGYPWSKCTTPAPSCRRVRCQTRCVMEALGVAHLPRHVWLSMNHVMHLGLTIQNMWWYPTRLRPSDGAGSHGTRGSPGPCHNGEGKPGSHVIRGDPEPSPCWLVGSGRLS